MMKMDFNESGAAFPLDRAKPGAELVVDHVEAGGSPASRRLLDLGVLPGTAIRVVRRAPLGDPVVYELRGYRLCLRRTEAAHIFVRARVAAAAPAASGDAT
jgi:Fe2+ transport system protein FeoA